MTALREKLLKIGAEVVSRGRYVTFQMPGSPDASESAPAMTAGKPSAGPSICHGIATDGSVRRVVARDGDCLVRESRSSESFI